MKLVRKSVKVEVKGEMKNYTNYYLVSATGSWVAIKPAFVNDYKALYVLAESVE